ncbi:hypothetical protein LWC33_21590 [Pseudonocardia sp. RS11V-5]|uniref:hypothetical protein n=1 Tax=Pseudonocardia terrae TaxID=2905831 RepID=UPI001E397EDD|nr:hypothetical protein [Pseudonocardia terrae]MCE3554035.1 hypothetical protein [Pseudonocardia terrae]
MRHPFRPRLPAVLAASLAAVVVGGLAAAALVVDTGPPGPVLAAQLRVTPRAAPVDVAAVEPTVRHQSARTPATTPQAPAPLALAGAVRAAASARAEADRTPCPSIRAAAPRLPGTGSRQGCPESPATDPTGPPLTP